MRKLTTKVVSMLILLTATLNAQQLSADKGNLKINEIVKNSDGTVHIKNPRAALLGQMLPFESKVRHFTLRDELRYNMGIGIRGVNTSSSKQGFVGGDVTLTSYQAYEAVCKYFSYEESIGGDTERSGIANRFYTPGSKYSNDTEGWKPSTSHVVQLFGTGKVAKLLQINNEQIRVCADTNISPHCGTFEGFEVVSEVWCK